MVFKLFNNKKNSLTKLRKIYAYLFKNYHFNLQSDYEDYWIALLEQGSCYISPYKLNLIANLIEEGSSVMDIGCGDGRMLEYLQKTKKINGEGIEVSMPAIEVARKRGLSIKQADVTRDDFALDRSYDYIIISEVLEHLPNAEEVMLKIRDRFHKHVLITIPNTGFLGERLRLLFGRFPKQWVFSPAEHLRFWTVTDFTFWCRQLGFRIDAYYGIYDEYYDIKIKLWQYWPKLFSRYILYKLSRSNRI